MKPETDLPDAALTILYFARLGEQLGCRQEAMDLPDGITTTGQLREYLLNRGAPWSLLAKPGIRMAVNQEIVGLASSVTQGDEVAFLPPVSGG